MLTLGRILTGHAGRKYSATHTHDSQTNLLQFYSLSALKTSAGVSHVILTMPQYYTHYTALYSGALFIVRTYLVGDCGNKTYTWS